MGAAESNPVVAEQTDNTATVNLGEIRNVGRCRPCGSGSSWGPGDCRDAFGDEWEYAGENGCGYGCQSTPGAPGTQAKCRMARYGGDMPSCCLGLRSERGSCNPAWNISDPGCDAAYNDYCVKNDNIIRDPICQRWRDIRPAQARQVTQNYCTTHLDDPECRTWCKTAADAGDGVCDGAMKVWCDKNPGDPLCTCIKSPLQNPQFGINPKCNDRKCIDSGYVTQNMRNTSCPDITNCAVQAKIINSGIQMAGVTIDQNCGSRSKTPGAAGGGYTGSNTKNVTTVPPPAGNTNKMWILLLVFLFIVIMAVVVTVIVYVSSEDEKPAE
jgi:hypothetical protein